MLCMYTFVYFHYAKTDVTVKLKYGAQAKKPTSASKTSSYSHTLLKQQILYRKNCIVYLKLYKPPL